MLNKKTRFKLARVILKIFAPFERKFVKKSKKDKSIVVLHLDENNNFSVLNQAKTVSRTMAFITKTLGVYDVFINMMFAADEEYEDLDKLVFCEYILTSQGSKSSTSDKSLGH